MIVEHVIGAKKKSVGSGGGSLAQPLCPISRHFLSIITSQACYMHKRRKSCSSNNRNPRFVLCVLFALACLVAPFFRPNSECVVGHRLALAPVHFFGFPGNTKKKAAAACSAAAACPTLCASCCVALHNLHTHITTRHQ